MASKNNIHRAFQLVGADIKDLKSSVSSVKETLEQLSLNAGDKYSAEAAAIESDIQSLKTKLSLSAGETNVLRTLVSALSTIESRVADKADQSSIQEIAAQEVAKVVDNAPENLNTLNEIALELQQRGGNFTSLVESVGVLSGLATTSKESLVAALNEVVELVNTNNSTNDEATDALTARVVALENGTGSDQAVDYVAAYEAARDAVAGA